MFVERDVGRKVVRRKVRFAHLHLYVCRIAERRGIVAVECLNSVSVSATHQLRVSKGRVSSFAYLHVVAIDSVARRLCTSRSLPCERSA